ncbi:MAG: methyl-accepting chemotaxis protein [Opitutaceae bacterium]|jgi:hypothetical protein
MPECECVHDDLHRLIWDLQIMDRITSTPQLSLPKVSIFGNFSGNPFRRRRVTHSRVPEICREASSCLADAKSGMENAFLLIGEKLVKMAECSTRLTGQCGDLLKLASGSHEGSVLLKESIGVLRSPLEYIDFCIKEKERLLRLLGQCEGQTKGLLDIGSRMLNAIAPLTFMAVLFKIESAYLPVEMRETFTTVTMEVERLHKLVDETFAQNARQMQSAYDTLSSVRSRLEEDFRKQETIIGEKRRRIDASMLMLDEQVAQNSERDSLLHSYSDSLSQEVGKVVIGVQLQDIIGQKCDHVMEALKTETGTVPVHQVRLQISQLQMAENDLGQGIKAMEDELDRINDFTSRLNESSVSLESFQSMTAAVDGMVQSLLDTLSDVHEIIGMVHDLAEQGNTAVQPANGIAGNLTTAISELSINMRLIALNAQVRSVQGGQGTGLELLAARTAEISDEINDISKQVSDDLSSLHAGIDEMLVTFAQFLNRGKEQNALLGASRGDTEKRLHALRDRALLVVQEIGTSAEQTLASVQDVRGALESLPGLRARFGHAIEMLSTIEPELDADARDTRHLFAHARRYTMESERKVHKALIASIGADTGPGVPADRAEASQQHPQPAKNRAMGDNVEFF